MKITFAMLAATTALTALLGLPAIAAMLVPESATDPSRTAPFDQAQGAHAYFFVSGDDDDAREDDDGGQGCSRDDDDEEEDDDEDGACQTMQPDAPTGPVAPPKNGLFGSDAPPQVKVN